MALKLTTEATQLRLKVGGVYKIVMPLVISVTARVHTIQLKEISMNYPDDEDEEIPVADREIEEVLIEDLIEYLEENKDEDSDATKPD